MTIKIIIFLVKRAVVVMMVIMNIAVQYPVGMRLIEMLGWWALVRGAQGTLSGSNNPPRVHLEPFWQ